MRSLLLLCLPVALTQCVDPYGNPTSPFGPASPPPYTERREQYRTDMREQDRDQTRQAYERGLRDGTDDARSGQARGNPRNPFGYSSAQGAAYTDGYEQGRRSTGPGGGAPSYGNAPGYGGGAPSYGNAPGYGGGAPSYGGGAPTYPGQNGGPPPSSQNDPAYSQGYEYGLRDRVAGRQKDAGAHVGRYDPRYRRSFDRGYEDAFESRR